jgi:signal transduction histidine kinase
VTGPSPGYGTRMTGVTKGASAPAADQAALKAAIEAARERQSYVRHELRAPLAVIYPLLSLLREGGVGELTAEQRDFLEVLDRNVVRLESLISAVADSGWADCSASPAMPVEVALGDVVEEVITMRRIGDEGGPSIVVDAGPPPAPRAWADRDDVRQIVADLIANAAAYTPPAGRVTVRITAGDTAAAAAATIVVADTGPGIPAEELPHVFDFGYRGELARRLRVPGLGAGLWVCRELAGRNGGSLSIAGEPGAGVTASLTLPATEKERT